MHNILHAMILLFSALTHSILCHILVHATVLLHNE